MKLVPEFLVCIYGQYFLHAHNLLGNKCLFFLVWEFVIMLIYVILVALYYKWPSNCLYGSLHVVIYWDRCEPLL